MAARSRSNGEEMLTDRRLVKQLMQLYQEFQDQWLVPGVSMDESVNVQLRNVSCVAEHFLPFRKPHGLCVEEMLDPTVGNALAKILVPNVVERTQDLVNQLNDTDTICQSIAGDLSRSFYNEKDREKPISLNRDTIHRSEIAVVVRQQLMMERSKNILRQLHVDLQRVSRDFLTSTIFLDDQTTYINQSNELAQSELLRESRNRIDDCLSQVLNCLPLSRANSEFDYYQRDLTESQLLICHRSARNCLNLASEFGKLFVKYREFVSSYKTNRTTFVDEFKSACRKLNALGDLYSLAPLVDKKGVTEYKELSIKSNDFSASRITKAEFAKAVLELSNRYYFPESVKNYFDDIRRYALNLHKVFNEASVGMEWLIKYYGLSSNNDLLMLAFNTPPHMDISALRENTVDFLLAAKSCIPMASNFSQNLMTTVDTNAQNFMRHYFVLRDHLQKYNDSLKLDDQFYRSNVLALNVYPRDISVEILKQKQSYDFWSLLSDIGGTLGLFLGASLLTVVEILEYLFGLFSYIFRQKYGSTSPPAESAKTSPYSNGRFYCMSRSSFACNDEPSDLTQTTSLFLDKRYKSHPETNNDRRPTHKQLHATTSLPPIQRPECSYHERLRVSITAKPWSERSENYIV